MISHLSRLKMQSLRDIKEKSIASNDERSECSGNIFLGKLNKKQMDLFDQRDLRMKPFKPQNSNYTTVQHQPDMLPSDEDHTANLLSRQIVKSSSKVNGQNICMSHFEHFRLGSDGVNCLEKIYYKLDKRYLPLCRNHFLEFVRNLFRRELNLVYRHSDPAYASMDMIGDGYIEIQKFVQSLGCKRVLQSFNMR